VFKRIKIRRTTYKKLWRPGKAEGIQKIIYLGGLGSGVSQLSPHLRSRQEVGEILRRSGIQVIEFRASIILGSGSLSFEMIRALVERLPIMITPRWVKVLFVFSGMLRGIARAAQHSSQQQ
jgi:uncharacterized protein YbjT (DUF2867 family)